MRIVTPQRMRDIEGYAINALGIDGLLLMERAALCLAQEIRKEQQLFAEYLGFLKEALQVGYSLEQAVGEERSARFVCAIAYKECSH